MLDILCTKFINLVYNDWFTDLSNIYNRMDKQIQPITQLHDICVAGAIRELCEARGSGVVQFIDATRCVTKQLN